MRVISGEIIDVAVDLRKNSTSYGEWISEKLSAINKKQLWIPEGFAHGFLTLSNEAEVLYKATNFFNPKAEESIIYNDSYLNIKWPELKSEYIVSKKDRMAKAFLETTNFDK